MAIECLKVSSLRNLSSVKIRPSPGVNLFFGENGSGKTSLLEAVYFLAVARSFRTNKLMPVVTKGQRSCAVYGEINLSGRVVPVGIMRGLDNQQVIRINSSNTGSVSDLAHLLPVQLLNPDVFTCLEGGPSERRRLLDWGVFHHSDSFLSAWKTMKVSLKQRNSLLKKKQYSGEELAIWSQSFANSGEIVDKLRVAYFNALLPEINSLLKPLAALSGVSFSYYRGWSGHMTLREAIEKDAGKDGVLGYTSAGPHRADIRITRNGLPVIDTLSRGQQKMLVCVIKIAQGKLFEKTDGRKCVYLFDDLLSELDGNHGAILSNMLYKTKSQVWITGVSQTDMAQLFSGDERGKMFHVKHGLVTET